MRRSLYVLIACEESQAETIAFRALGHRAYSCDLESVSPFGCPRWHIKGDVWPFLQGKTSFRVESGDSMKVPQWDLIIAHPPCTYLCRLSKAATKQREKKGIDIATEIAKARDFFFECLNAKAQYVAVENPIPRNDVQLPPPSCYASPEWYGSRFTKKTYYWLRNLPPLMAERINYQATSLVAARRGKYRSRTEPALAMAIAKQWSDYIMNDLANER